MGFMMAGCVLVGAADLGAIGAGVCGEEKMKHVYLIV